jgi:uncharacterized RDD family membrane protein YckC
VAFTVVWVTGKLLALLAVTDAGYDGLGFMERAAAVAAREPAWAIAATWIGVLWFWSEIVTMLFNRRRRALHDFIAGTVVLSDREPPED